ncbi:hypothetical protein EOS99_11120 [Listeria ivanovii]|nr:hypothetical protein C1910_02310 [Listeria ivanovii]PZG54890.1 hypothetical protein C1909_01725 [Listeria ivanovii]QDA72720.1 hypothetical protein EOS99_11120 [Listeria ivanovii]
MYNQKCNEMSDSCHERLEKGLFIIITTQIVYRCSFASVKKPQFESLFTNYSTQNKIVAKRSIINVSHVFLIVILNLFLK